MIRRVLAVLALLGAAIVPSACTESPPPPKPPAPPHFAFPGTKADHIVVYKSLRRLELFRDGQLLKAYHVSLGPDPVGPKRREGDGRTPEGHYIIDARYTHTRYYLALHISYPNTRDRAWAASRHISPGGAILIHGIGFVIGGVTKAEADSDWTEGCIAVTNSEMDQIWAAVDNGTPIDIYP